MLCQVLLTADLLRAVDVATRGWRSAWFALVAVIGAFASATQDVVIDAWRIDVADEEAPVEILSSIYQFGYRIAALIGGALALVLSERMSWPTVYAVMGGFMALTLIATLLAPDTPRDARRARAERASPAGRDRAEAARDRAWRSSALGWAWAIWTVGAFMVNMLGGAVDPATGKPPCGRRFHQGLRTVDRRRDGDRAGDRRRGVQLAAERARAMCWTSDAPATSGRERAADHAYSALILPLAELVRRIGWGVIIVLGLILSYRITDNIWGRFAFPFYLEELKYTGDEVAFASKIFGVFMTMAGIAIGGICSRPSGECRRC